MNAFDRYFTWINQVFDRNKDRVFFISTCVWIFYMGAVLCGICVMFVWTILAIVWEILSFLFGTIKRICK